MFASVLISYPPFPLQILNDLFASPEPNNFDPLILWIIFLCSLFLCQSLIHLVVNKLLKNSDFALNGNRHYMLRFCIQEVLKTLWFIVCANEHVFLMLCKRDNLDASAVIVSLLTIIISWVPLSNWLLSELINSSVIVSLTEILTLKNLCHDDNNKLESWSS